MAIRTFSRSFRTDSVEAHAVLAFRAEQRLGLARGAGTITDFGAGQ